MKKCRYSIAGKCTNENVACENCDSTDSEMKACTPFQRCVIFHDDNWAIDVSEEKKYEERIVNVKVEYDLTPIRNLAVQCPKCGNWFSGYEILEYVAEYKEDLPGSPCHCPRCGSYFRISNRSKVEENADFSDIL